MDAALRLTADGRSFDSLGLRELTREVGVSPASFYRHFKSTEELGLALVERVCQDLRPLMREARREAATATDVAMEESVALYLRYVRQHAAEFTFLSHAYAGIPPALFPAVQREIRHFVLDLAEDLRVVPPLVDFPAADVEMIANLIVHMVLTLTRDVLATPAEHHVREAELRVRGVKQLRVIILGAMAWQPMPGESHSGQ